MPGDATTRGAGTHAASQFQCSCYLYWRAVREVGEVRLGARGYLTRSALRTVRARMGLEEPDRSATERIDELQDARLFFMRRLLQRMGLLYEGSPGILVAAERKAMQYYVLLPLTDQVRRCTRLWLAGGWWSTPQEGLGQPPKLMAPAAPGVAIARRRLLQALLESPDDVVVPLPPRRAERSPAGRRGSVHIHQKGKTPWLRRPETSVLADEETRDALLGPLSWMGLVAPAHAGARLEDRVNGYCTTQALDALRSPPAELAEANGQVIVQANLEVIALPPLAARTLFSLDACAEARSIGGAATYALTRSAFAAAYRAGWNQGSVAARLERLSGEALPQNVQVTLADWERRLRRLRMYVDVTLLEVRDARLIDTLLADPQAAVWVERRLTPNVVLLHDHHVEAARNWLLRHGEMPAVARASGDESSGTPDAGRG